MNARIIGFPVDRLVQELGGNDDVVFRERF